MLRNRILPAIFAGVMVLSLAPALRADTKLIISHSTGHAGIGAWIGGRVAAPIRRPPVRGPVMVTRPWHHRFVRLGRPRIETVVVRPPAVQVVYPPVERQVVIEHAPVVAVKAPVVEASTIAVWITNSNGSRTSVQLTREGPWYVGPRGEYYTEMPTNEQLRVVYGF